MEGDQFSSLIAKFKQQKAEEAKEKELKSEKKLKLKSNEVLRKFQTRELSQ